MSHVVQSNIWVRCQEDSTTISTTIHWSCFTWIVTERLIWRLARIIRSNMRQPINDNDNIQLWILNIEYWKKLHENKINIFECQIFCRPPRIIFNWKIWKEEKLKEKLLETLTLILMYPCGEPNNRFQLVLLKQVRILTPFVKTGVAGLGKCLLIWKGPFPENTGQQI